MKTIGTFLFLKTEKARKKLHGRSGSLLILVLVIMAVALILITSAMTITVAARTHYNVTAEMDQTQLTAMSAAKMIGDAVRNGEIDGAQLEAMAVSRTKYSLLASNTVSPGLANDSTSNTSVLFDSTVIAGTTYITVDVTTHIDNTSIVEEVPVPTDSCVRLLLQKIVLSDNGSFVNQLTAGPGTVDFTNVNVGEVPAGVTTIGGAAVVTYGDVMYAGGGSAIFETDVIVMGRLTSNAGITFKKNLIIWQDASIASDYGSGMAIGGSLLVLGKSGPQTPLFTDALGNASPLTSSGGTTVTGGIYVINKMYETSNRTVTFDSSAGVVWDTNSSAIFPANTNGTLNSTNHTGVYNGTYYRADSTSSITQGGVSVGTPVFTETQKPIIKTLRDLVANNYSAQLTASTEREVLTTEEAYSNLLGLDASADKTGSVLASAAGAKNLAYLNGLNALNVQYGSAKVVTTLSAHEGSAYYIDTAGNVLANKTLGSTGGYNGSDNNYSKIIFDLQYGPITLYIIDSDGVNNGIGTFTIGNGLIQFINGDPTQGMIGRILLLDGTDINTTEGGNGCPYDTGIIGSDHVATSSERTKVEDLGTSIPYLYIYGFQDNLIQVLRAVTMEGYIGLYGTGGQISFYNTQKYEDLSLIYCRVEAGNFTSAQGSFLEMTYCPPPDSSSGGGGTVNAYTVSGYVVK